MRTIHILILCLLLCFFFGHPLNAQTCGPEAIIDTSGYEGSAFFNYGSSARVKSSTYKTAFAVGQSFVGYTENINRNSSLGFYTRYFLPPFGLKVTATQGDFLDHIQISWEIDALGPAPTGGFDIFRDGVSLISVESNIRSYNDPAYNIIAGRPYVYTVRGKNSFGPGVGRDAVGYLVPNGVVTGWISTLNGNPVPDAEVVLTPMQGFSAKFDQGDGAFAMQDTSTTPFLPALDHDWTIAFWIKTDTSINGRIIGMDSLYIRGKQSARGGILVSKTAGGTPYLSADFPVNTKHNWHHVALTYDGNGNKHRMYFDGNLVDIATSLPVPPPDTINFGALANVGNLFQKWKGKLDEFRIYDRRLDELDFDMVMDGTASSETPNLTHYWKMDEQLGVKSYDIVKRQKLYFCGAIFDADRPPVHTAGITNEDGYYKIESASYGTGTTFLARPKKNFYMHRALKFNKEENDYATLPDFPITNKATIELWVNSAGPDGNQTLLYKKWGNQNFRLFLNANGTGNDIKININGTLKTFGTLGSGYQHLAFTWDNGTIQGYKNDTLLNTFIYTGVTGDWSDPSSPWLVGTNNNGTSNVNFYGGLIDEIAFYDTTLTVAEIKDHFLNARDMQEKGLRVYFPLDEGSGNKISNVGSVLMDGGTTSGTEWSPLASHQIIQPHVFAPSTRQVTLNPSVTSVDQVDFTDRSTIGVSGYVRYKNTDCFAVNVEILVNGESFHPQIFTDSTGLFSIDFDPGTSVTLTPKLEGHVFVPASWEIINVSSPIAGILFTDITTRKISGQVTGGDCRKSIIRMVPFPGDQSQNTVCIVKVSSVDGCLERQITINNAAGNFVFDNLPPLPKMTVAVVEHSDPDIKEAFQSQGGSVVDLSTRNDTTDFIYKAPPQVVIVSGLHPYSPTCDKIVLNQFDLDSIRIRIKEHYLGGDCFLDTADIHIINGFADEVIDTTMSGGILKYRFTVSNPNPSPPYLKTLQIIGTTEEDREADTTVQAIVTGIKAKENTFTTLLPEIPSLILRDPPGDGSSSYLEKDQEFCQTTEVSYEDETGLGGGIQVVTGGSNDIVLGFLVAIVIKYETEQKIGPDAQITAKVINNHSFETCTSFNEKISTSDDDIVVGGEQGGDLYMGTALNIVYGNADIVTFHPNLCEAVDSTTVIVQPGDFATTFAYSEFYIRNTLLPSLQTLAESPASSDEDVARYEESITRWDSILAYNKALKDKARFIKNISFDAGSEYEYSETSDTTTSESLETQINSEFTFADDFKLTFAGFGVKGNVRFIHNTSGGGKNEDGTRQGVTTGYTLKDDDPLDAFTFDVGMDSVYKTPVFDIKAGQSSCPWEPKTANREEPNLQLDENSHYVATNVPANEAAVFKLKLGNLSATNEDWTYSFTSLAEHNPDGAVIKLNGQPLNYLQDYIIPYGTSQTVTLTVERGPVEYDYDDLVVAEVSACQYERDLALSLSLEEDTQFISTIPLSVHFIRPCSEVNINVPQQDWVIFPNPLTDSTVNDNILRITVSGYDLSEPSFQLVRLQYRQSDGDGAWINIPGIAERWNQNWAYYDTLSPAPPKLQTTNFTQFFWNTASLKDGPYEIRAVAICTGDATDRPGYSEVIKGRIDRLPPKLVGVPQPSDGVLQVGDEISFTFNKPINCNKLIKADMVHPNNVGLYDATTNKLIGSNVTCGDNKIVIDPTFQNKFYENHVVRAELHNIQDLTGNILDSTKWSFFVDRNELAWLTDSVGMTKYEDETKSTTVKIHNRGGSTVSFTIDSIPSGVNVAPNAGTIVANGDLEIKITAADTLDRGWINDSIVLHTVPGQNPFFMGGDEKLPFGVRTICRPPDWNIDPTLYQFSMNMVARIQFDTSPPYGNSYVLSSDPEDQVAAFINGELRGTAKLVKSAPNNTYKAFVTIYGNTADIGDSLTFELFNASECKHYPAVLSPSGTFNFSIDGTQGSPGAPKILQNYGPLLSDVPLKKGWNWISFNLGFPDPSINQALHNIPNAAGDLIKDQTHFAVYNSGTWTGSLTSMTNTSAYLYQAAKPNNIKIIGYPLTPASVQIPIVKGMNWIGYIPTYSLPVTNALATLHPKAGDIIKSQDAFAEYVSSTSSWVGNLKTMEPLHGYLLKIDTAGTLTYPLPLPFTSDEHIKSRSAESLTSFWNVDAAQYEFNMTLIGNFQFNDMNATTADMELGAFVGDELRGVGEAVYVEYLDAYVFFMTGYANKSGEQLHFKLYDSSNGEIQDLKEKMTFAPNDNEGSIESPVPFTLQTTGTEDVSSELSLNVKPNPFRDETVCFFELPDAQKVHIIITDMDGKNLYVNQIQANAGMNSFVWKGCSTNGTLLSNGVYFIRLETDEGILTKKVMLQR